MAESKMKQGIRMVHSVYDGTTELQVSGTTYYSLFNLTAGTWIITLTFYTYAGEVLICYGNTINNNILECGKSSFELGQSGAGIIQLNTPTTIQMYCTQNTTLYRFKAEAIRIA